MDDGTRPSMNRTLSMSSNTSLVRITMAVLASWRAQMTDMGFNVPNNLVGRNGVATLMRIAKSAIIREKMSAQDVKREMMLIREYRLPHIYKLVMSYVPEVEVLTEIHESRDKQIQVAETAFIEAINDQKGRMEGVSGIDSLWVHFYPRREMFRMANGDTLLGAIQYTPQGHASNPVGPSDIAQQIDITRADILMTLGTWMYLGIRNIAVSFNPTDRLVSVEDTPERVVPNARRPNNLRANVGMFARSVYGMDMIMTQVVTKSDAQRLAGLIAQRVVEYGVTKSGTRKKLKGRTLLGVLQRFQQFVGGGPTTKDGVLKAMYNIVRNNGEEVVSFVEDASSPPPPLRRPMRRVRDEVPLTLIPSPPLRVVRVSGMLGDSSDAVMHDSSSTMEEVSELDDLAMFAHMFDDEDDF